MLMTSRGRRVLAWALVSIVFCSLSVGLSREASAQAYPSRPIRIVVPYSPGGATDIVGRIMGQRLQTTLGQPIIIDNKPGGNTAIGADAVAKAQPDGYTLLFSNDATFVINPTMFASLSYNVRRDFAPVATVSYLPLTLAIRADLPVNSMKELVAYVKARPGKTSYGSSGVGSQLHLMGEMFKTLTGTDPIHVPYKGAAPAVADVISGQILFTFPAVPTIQGFVKSGRVKVLALSGKARAPLLPDVPTFTEVGFKDMDIGVWQGLLAPAGTPKDVIAKLNAAVGALLADREFVDKHLAPQGMVPMISTPEQFVQFMQSELARMAAIVKQSGAKVE